MTGKEKIEEIKNKVKEITSSKHFKFDEESTLNKTVEEKKTIKN